MKQYTITSDQRSFLMGILESDRYTSTVYELVRTVVNNNGYNTIDKTWLNSLRRNYIRELKRKQND